MNLIPVNVSKNDEQYVSGRDLHMFLEINTPYSKWFSRMCEYGFVENVDYTTKDKKSSVTTERSCLKHNLNIT
uniref:AntA/AntB antirepressor n=1 Tax=Podoviridae sp. ctrJu12 TaxID=2825278 RepID=A0A8S5U8X4_9CAUD|nr:MAG TPA: AntA/AntB antirepressor [Podoviridae sp. ctrJu12]